jgi:glyoxylase-like metal-dependent hydrolase (beta-lactamase superfamily II)
MAKITSFIVGHCTHPSCMALKGSGFATRCFPSRAYLIETKNGLHLWDTGYASRFYDAVSKGVNRLYGWVTPVFFDESSSLVSQLAAVGVRPADIQSVTLSHFHADHMAGVKDFPNAMIACCAYGWAAHKHLSGLAALRRAFLPELLPNDFYGRFTPVQVLSWKPLPAELSPFPQGFDLTGTGEVFIVPLPGHADGHLGAFVLEDSGWTLLASDAAWAPEGYRDLRGPSELSFLIQDNRREYYETLQNLHQLHTAGNVKIQLTHEEPAATASEGGNYA